MKKWFHKNELDLIETAFEKFVICNENKTLEIEIRYKYGDFVAYKNTPLANKAIVFGKKFNSDSKRMLAILENILKNGEFKP